MGQGSIFPSLPMEAGVVTLQFAGDVSAAGISKNSKIRGTRRPITSAFIKQLIRFDNGCKAINTA
jgi:hypothetical protein